jgi:hypothetical protein
LFGVLLVQVLLPAYDASSLVALVLHSGERTVGRCMLRLHGLLPLLLKRYSKSLSLFRWGLHVGMYMQCKAQLAVALTNSYGQQKLAFCIVHAGWQTDVS